MRSLSPFRRLQAWLFVLPLLSLGCNGSSPTEPALEQARASTAAVTATAEGQTAPAAPVAARGEDGSAEEMRPGAARLNAARIRAQGVPAEEVPNVAVADPARGGNGNGNGNGNSGNGGGNGNGGNGGNGGGAGLTFEIKPDTWNTNWVNAAGNVQAFVRGRGVAGIDRASVELVADGGTLAPKSVRVAGGQLVATFDKSEAFELLGDDVESGDRETVTLRFTVDGGAARELDDQVRIVGSNSGGGGGSGELELNIQPDTWNVSWERSSGQVHAFLRGPGIADVDLDSLWLVGDSAAAAPIAPLDARRVGRQIVARFSKSAAYATLDDPDAGETHTVKIRLMQGGEQKEIAERVRINGRQ